MAPQDYLLLFGKVVLRFFYQVNRKRKKMIDIKIIRENPELVKENIKKKFQDEKIPFVDEIIEKDRQRRDTQVKIDQYRKERNDLSSQIGLFMREGKKEEAENNKKRVNEINQELVRLEELERELAEAIQNRMMVIPNMIDKSVPIGKDDSENVEIEKFGEPFVRDYEIPYHADICENLGGLDKESAGRTSGNGFYYLIGDIARLHEATIAYARDFMISKGFTYAIPPFMIRSDVVTGVMSFAEMDAMMYKIEGEDLYLIGTSEHSMIGKFKGQIIDEAELPIAMTSYSPCFRKEVGAHGLEERGLYRVHQFEKQEMIVLCKPEEAMEWYNKMWSYTVEFFRSMGISVRTLECCSGDLADLKVKSCDVEAWSPRQQKYFEVGSCSTLGDAQARRLGIRMKTENGNQYLATLNNTVIASPRSLIAILEQCYQKDGSVKIPKVLQPYMGGLEVLQPKLKEKGE
jgi:seryl-tRNA synthetase